MAIYKKEELIRVLDDQYTYLYEKLFNVIMKHGIPEKPRDMKQIRRIMDAYNNRLVQELTGELSGNGYFDR